MTAKNRSIGGAGPRPAGRLAVGIGLIAFAVLFWQYLAVLHEWQANRQARSDRMAAAMAAAPARIADIFDSNESARAYRPRAQRVRAMAAPDARLAAR